MPNVMDNSCEFFAVIVVEKLRQSHRLVEPRGDNFDILVLVHSDQVVHCRDVAAWGHCDRLPWFDGYWKQIASFGAHMVCGNRAYWVHEPCVVSKAVNLLSGVGDPEFAVVFDQRGAAQVKWPQAIIDDVGLKECAAITEESVA